MLLVLPISTRLVSFKIRGLGDRTASRTPSGTVLAYASAACCFYHGHEKCMFKPRQNFTCKQADSGAKLLHNALVLCCSADVARATSPYVTGVKFVSRGIVAAALFTR